MRRDIVWTKRFKKDYERMLQHGQNMDLLDDVIRMLARGDELPANHRDHALTGDMLGYRECHIRPDWLLIYRIEEDVLMLTLSRTGSRSDLFK